MLQTYSRAQVQACTLLARARSSFRLQIRCSLTFRTIHCHQLQQQKFVWRSCRSMRPLRDKCHCCMIGQAAGAADCRTKRSK